MPCEEHQRAFFLRHWPAMQRAARQGAGALAAFVSGFDEAQRRILYAFAREGLTDGPRADLDLYVAVARAGLREVLAQASRAPDAVTRRARLSLAAAIAYNLAADLVDCRPGDPCPRARRHFEAGLRAARRCIRWRSALGDGPGRLSVAWWAKGMHELSLGRPRDAVRAWTTARDLAAEAARERWAGEDDPGVLLTSGYLGLARWVAGQGDGRRQLEEASRALRRLGGEAAEALAHLEAVAGRYGPGE